MLNGQFSSLLYGKLLHVLGIEIDSLDVLRCYILAKKKKKDIKKNKTFESSMKNIYEFYEKNCEIVMKKWQEKGQSYIMIGNSNFPSLSKKDTIFFFFEKWC